MTNDTKPDDATGDSVTNAESIARVHAFMCALLTFLGFKVLPVETIVDMLDTLETWLVDAKTIRRDTQGATAKIWWDAFKTMWSIPKMSASEAGVYADKAAGEFGKRFLPVAEEDDRDTLNTADFDAMRTELDQADRYRSEICNALDGVEGNRAFVHGKVIDELRAERDTLLKANAHHASELAYIRQTKDGFIERLEKALGVDNGADIIDAIESMEKQNESFARTIAEFSSIITGACVAMGCEHASLLPSKVASLASERDTWKGIRAEDLREMATLGNALDGVRATILAPSLPDNEVAGVIRRIVDERDALKAQLAGAIVPLPQPTIVEPGQLWAIVMGTANDCQHGSKMYKFINADGSPYFANEDDLAKAYYLGTDKA